MSTPISPALASVLHSGRESFNARFTEMKRRHPALERDAFLSVVGTCLGPMVDAVAAAQPEYAAPVVWAGYDAALQLVKERLIGPGGRHPVIEEAWQRLLPALAPLLAQSPTKVIASVSNAVCRLADTDGADEDLWILCMEEFAPEFSTVQEFLAAGQLAAWRCGLAQYREGALVAGDTLPEKMGARVLGVESTKPWPELKQAILDDPWWTPDGRHHPSSLHVTQSVGTFRGFGGLFTEPPRVQAVEGNLYVQSGAECWLLTADAFGATLHREDPALLPKAAPTPLLPGGLRVQVSTVSWGHSRLDLSSMGPFTSFAVLPRTLAVTGKYTHAVTLIATP